MHSVLDSDVPRPMCISNPNRPKCWYIISMPLMRSSLVPNGNAPSLTYKHCSISYAVRLFDVNMTGVWLQIRPSIRLLLAAVITVTMGIFCCFHTISSVSANAVMRKRNRTGAMLSPCCTPTVWGISAFSFSILRTHMLSVYIVLTAATNLGGGSVLL